MIYPKFLKKGGAVGVAALSGGIGEKRRAGFELSLMNLKKRGFEIKKQGKIYTEDYPASGGKERGESFNSLVKDPDVAVIMNATGGDFCLEMLPYVDYAAFERNPKWVQGYSDPTVLLYSLTTKCSVATIYSGNAGSFDMEKLHKSLEDNLSIIEGKVPIQTSFEKYESGKGEGEYSLDTPVRWLSPSGDFSASGRLIGGCIECLRDIVGTPYDGGAEFLEKYKNDGFIWYFDIFAMPADMVFATLWRMREMGYFKYAKAAVFGRVLIKNDSFITLEDAVKRALGDLPFVLDADIGHVKPTMTLINGAFAVLNVKGQGGSLEMKLI